MTFRLLLIFLVHKACISLFLSLIILMLVQWERSKLVQTWSSSQWGGWGTDGGSRGSGLPLVASVGSGREGVGQGGVIVTECGWIPTRAVVLTDKPTADCECSQERRPSEAGSGGGRARRRERVAGGRAHGRCARSARSSIWFPPSGTVLCHREKEESVGSSLCQGSVTQCLAGSQGSWVRTYIYWS